MFMGLYTLIHSRTVDQAVGVLHPVGQLVVIYMYKSIAVSLTSIYAWCKPGVLNLSVGWIGAPCCLPWQCAVSWFWASCCQIIALCCLQLTPVFLDQARATSTADLVCCLAHGLPVNLEIWQQGNGNYCHCSPVANFSDLQGPLWARWHGSLGHTQLSTCGISSLLL